MIPQLRDYQLDLFRRVREARARGARIIVVQAATGAGKTSWACFTVREAIGKGSHCLLMAHRRKLVEQISQRLEDFKISHGIIMRGEKVNPNYSVQVASRDTLLSRCVRNEWVDMPQAQLVIVDEGHHAADPTSEYRRIIECYPKATILLLTASPVGPDGRGMGPWAQAIECAAPTSQLVNDGHLVPVRVYAPDRKLHHGKPRKRGIAGDLVESWKQYAENMPTVLFCSRVSHSQDAVARFSEEGISAMHIDADTPDDVRENAFEMLQSGSLKIVSNVGIITEGVDVPALGCCQLYCEVGGRVKFLQAIGRIMRPFEGKEYGIVIDHSGAVFNHGFPDEDTEWTLEGNVDEDFKEKKKNDQTDPVHYCKKCEMLFKTAACPQCGKMPSKPPRSIFAAPPVNAEDELLTEAERGGDQSVWSEDQKRKHWLRCLGVAARRNGSFGMAAQIYKQKYSEFPGDGFPCIPERWEWKSKVVDKYPNFGRKKESA